MHRIKGFIRTDMVEELKNMVEASECELKDITSFKTHNKDGSIRKTVIRLIAMEIKTKDFVINDMDFEDWNRARIWSTRVKYRTLGMLDASYKDSFTKKERENLGGKSNREITECLNVGFEVGSLNQIISALNRTHGIDLEYILDFESSFEITYKGE